MGQIYFLQAGTDGPIKIGFTEVPIKRRIANLQTGCPWKIYKLALKKGKFRDEQAVHQHFEKYELCGEWFLPDPKIFRFIASLSKPGFEWPQYKKREPKNYYQPYKHIRSESDLEPILVNSVLTLALAFARATGKSFDRISRLCNGDPPFLKNLLDGKASMSVRSYDKAVDWFQTKAQWPNGTECPRIRDQIAELDGENRK
jgi:hypothetical protein